MWKCALIHPVSIIQTLITLMYAACCGKQTVLRQLFKNGLRKWVIQQQKGQITQSPNPKDQSVIIR